LNDIDAVLQQIVQALDDSNRGLAPSPVPSPTGRGSDKKDARKRRKFYQPKI
jgi:hypothetical protein